MTGTDPTDRRGTGRAVVSMVAGSVVGLLTGTVVWSFLVAASWSSIHGGMSVVMLTVLSVLAMAIPPGSGVLAGWGVYRSWPQLQRRPTRVSDSIRLTCPHCGCSMRRAAECSATPAYTVVKCPIHGPFHFGPGTDLTLGAPPPA